MKIKLVFLLLTILLASCGPATEPPATSALTEPPVTEEAITQESIATEVATEVPTEAPTEPPLACVTLLTPLDGVEIPNIGKATFSWAEMADAGKYILNIILPSGDVVSFETDATTFEKYMEGFTQGGEYGWNVIAQTIDGNEICVSDVAHFDKAAYIAPRESGGGGGDNDGDSGGSSGWCQPGVDFGCEGGGGEE